MLDCALVAYSPVSGLPVEAAGSFAASEWFGEATSTCRLTGTKPVWKQGQLTPLLPLQQFTLEQISSVVENASFIACP